MATSVKKKSSGRAKPATPKAVISFHKHILPPLLGVGITLSLVAILNGQWLVAQTQYHFASRPTTASIEEITKGAPSSNAQPTIIIPAIKVTAPVIDEKSTNEVNIQLALRQGVDHYGTSAYPGENGNIVLFGHSSGQVWAPGKYKFVFTLLNKLQPNESILIDYKGVRYVYRVTDTKIVKPTDFSVIQPTDHPQLTLITCTPVGTSKNRLVIHARQVSPDVSLATPVQTANQKVGSAGSLPR